VLSQLRAARRLPENGETVDPGRGAEGRFRGRVALVTGGSKGLGFAVASRLAAEGAAVGILALHESSARASAAEITARGGEAIGMAGDVSAEGDVRGCVETVVAAFGRLDVMVNNAGTVFVGPVTETPTAEWDRVVAVNLRGVFLGCREAARRMIAQGSGGRILNCSSIGGRRGAPLFGAYAASKAAVIGLTQSLAAELAPHGITVNAYCPGHVTTTPMWEEIDASVARITGVPPGDVRAAAAGEVPVGRSGTAEEIAAVVAFLASAESSFMTGETVVVDGGLTRY
jgi:meso-butanediol dehydrogenase/(S,S)-butanediol dehydrogenase/diacetyl reductase